MSSFTALMQLAAERTDASNAQVNSAIAARQRAEAERRKAQEERERKERENAARLRAKRLEEEKRAEERRLLKEEADRARARERERKEAEARAALLGKPRQPRPSNWGNKGGERGVKRQRSESPDPASQLTREEKRARKEALALARSESSSSTYRRPTAHRSHMPGRRLAGGAVDAVVEAPLPVAPGSGSAKSRLAAIQPGLIKLNVNKRDMRTIDEIQRDNAARKALVGDAAKGFNDWFGKEKAKREKEEAEAKRVEALLAKQQAKAPVVPPAATKAPTATTSKAKPAPAPPSRVSAFASSSKPSKAPPPAKKAATVKPTAPAKGKKRAYDEDDLDAESDDFSSDDARPRKKPAYQSGEIWRLVAGKDRSAYAKYDDYDSDDMEVGANELALEEARSARVAKKEDALALAEEKRREEEKRRRKMATGRA